MSIMKKKNLVQRNSNYYAYTRNFLRSFHACFSCCSFCSQNSTKKTNGCGRATTYMLHGMRDTQTNEYEPVVVMVCVYVCAFVCSGWPQSISTVHIEFECLSECVFQLLSCMSFFGATSLSFKRLSGSFSNGNVIIVVVILCCLHCMMVVCVFVCARVCFFGIFGYTVVQKKNISCIGIVLERAAYTQKELPIDLAQFCTEEKRKKCRANGFQWQCWRKRDAFYDFDSMKRKLTFPFAMDFNGVHRMNFPCAFAGMVCRSSFTAPWLTLHAHTSSFWRFSFHPIQIILFFICFRLCFFYFSPWSLTSFPLFQENTLCECSFPIICVCFSSSLKKFFVSFISFTFNF